MTPLTLQLVKAAAIVVGAGIVLRRFSFREFPASVTWMLWEVAMQIATLGTGSLPAVALLVEAGICAAASSEVIRQSRIGVGLDIQVRGFLWALASSKVLSSIPALTSVQSWGLFRSYFLLFAFLALFATTVARWRYPVLERKANKVLRVGMTVWVFALAISGAFVKGGLGYKFFPYTMSTWRVVNTATHCLIAVVVITMAYSMYMAVPGRKHAAKDTKGRTRTGLIEMEKAA